MQWPPTQHVDIGDRAVCARVMGHGPTVVLEAVGAGEGIGETFSGTVEEQLGEFATVLTYDRVGSGRTGGSPRGTVAEMADDLDALLSATGCQTPASLPQLARNRGALVIEINPDDTELSDRADLSWRSTAAKALPALIASLNQSQ